MADPLNGLSNVFTLLFVVTSMLSMGLSLTVAQILQPLRNTRLVVMALLVVVTVGYLPLVLPLLLPGVTVDAGAIALQLFLEILVPLALGLLVKARWDETAEALVHPIGQIANISLALLLVLMLGLNLGKVLGLIGSGALLATLILLVIAVGSGYLLGGPGADTRRVLALGTGQRNMAAGFAVATSNFAAQPDVLVFLAAAGLVGMIVVMPVAAEFGKRARAAAAPAPAPAEPAPAVRPAAS